MHDKAAQVLEIRTRGEIFAAEVRHGDGDSRVKWGLVIWVWGSSGKGRTSESGCCWDGMIVVEREKMWKNEMKKSSYYLIARNLGSQGSHYRQRQE